MSPRAWFAVELVAGLAACLLFWSSPFCGASFVALAACAVGAAVAVIRS